MSKYTQKTLKRGKKTNCKQINAQGRNGNRQGNQKDTGKDTAELTLSRWYHRMNSGGVGLKCTTQVRLRVLPLSRNTSPSPSSSAVGTDEEERPNVRRKTRWRWIGDARNERENITIERKEKDAAMLIYRKRRRLSTVENHIKRATTTLTREREHGESGRREKQRFIK